MKIPLCIPCVGEEELDAIRSVLESGWLTHGPKNREFAARFAEYIGVKHAIPMNSCTSALQLALEAQGITGEVILPSFTFVASANAIVNAGAQPVFADIEYDTCNIDPSSIKASVTSRTEAIMVVHFGGQSCRMDAVMQIAERHGLAVIEDSAETIGGEFRGQKAGSFATGCFSFYPTKNITTGDGGMLTTDNDELGGKVRALIAHGISSIAHEREGQAKPWFRSAMYAGYNFRMSDILAAIGVEQMKKIDGMNEARREHAAYLSERLAGLDQIDLPVELPECKHVYQMYTIKVKDVNRDEFVGRLRNRGISASVHFDPSVHLQEYYRTLGTSPVPLPVTERVSRSIVTLPMYPQLNTVELDYMVKVIKETLAIMETV